MEENKSITRLCFQEAVRDLCMWRKIGENGKSVEECRKHIKEFTSTMNVEPGEFNFHEGNSGLILSVGEQDMTTGFFPFALYLLDGGMYILDEGKYCAQAMTNPGFFVTREHVMKTVGVDYLPPHIIDIVVEAASHKKGISGYPSDSDLQEAYKDIVEMNPLIVDYSPKKQYVISFGRVGQRLSTLFAETAKEADEMLCAFMGERICFRYSSGGGPSMTFYKGAKVAHVFPIGKQTVFVLPEEKKRRRKRND